MLHPIKLPATSRYLDWIVTFQGHLIHALCNPACRGDQILDEEWVISTCDQLNLGIEAKWLKKFCNWKHEGKTALERMRAIADLDTDTKLRIQTAFDHDIQIENAYSDDSNHIDNPFGLSNLSHLPQVQDLVHRFFESFYHPALYKGRGYKIPDNGQQVLFDRNRYVEQFADENPDVMVCPMCDGDLGSAEVDHYLPKAQYPYLSCHPKNLVPICHNCNAPGVKHEKPPLSLATENHTFDWFHPYLRNATKMYTVYFERLHDGLTPGLRNDDPQINRRLDNLSELINLRTRWRSALSRKMRLAQKRVEGEIRRRNTKLNDQDLLQKVEEWSESQEFDIGLEPFAILGIAYLQSVLQRDPETLDELFVYANTDLDVVSLTELRR